MKTIRLWTAILAVVSMAASCGKNELVVTGLSDMGRCDGSVFVSDGGIRYVIRSTDTEEPVPAQDRLFLSFNIVGQNEQGYDIHVKTWATPLVKDWLKATSVTDDDALGHDPVRVSGGWQGGGYLNMEIGVTFLQGSETKHLINLVLNDATADTDTLRLTLRHNGGGESVTPDMLNADTEDTLWETYANGVSMVCFPTEGLLPAGVEEMPFKISSTWYVKDEQGAYSLQERSVIGLLRK